MSTAGPRRPPDAARLAGLGLVGLAGAVAVLRGATSFGGFFLDDDVLNMRWVLEHRDAPWVALTERHALHDHIRPFNLLAHWLGAAASDGAWWGPHLVLVLLFLGAVAAAMGVARELAVPERRRVTAGLAGLFVASLPAAGKLVGWNAWMGSAGELAFGLTAVLVGLRARRLRGVVAAALLVVCAGLFKEPGWIVYPLALAAFAGGELLAGRRDRVVVGLLALPALGAAGLAWVWHPANVSHYADGGAALAPRVMEALTLFGRSTASTWPAGEGGGIVLLAVVFAGFGAVAGRPLPREVARTWAVPAALLAVGLGVMLPNPDLHPVHLLPAACGVAIGVAIGLGRLPVYGLAGAIALILALGWQLASLPAALSPAAPLRAEEVLRSRLLGLAALVRTVEAQGVAVPPGDANGAGSGEGAYVREATRFLVPYTGAPSEGEKGGAPRRGPPGMPLFTEGATLRVSPATERLLLERNALARLGAKLEVGDPAPVAVEAGAYAIGAMHHGGEGEDAAIVATDACGARWEAPPTDASRQLVLLPLQISAGCLPLSLGLSRAVETEVFFLFVPLDAPRLTLWGAPTADLPTLLDVTSRVGSRTPIPSFEPGPPR